MLSRCLEKQVRFGVLIPYFLSSEVDHAQIKLQVLVEKMETRAI